MGRAKNGRNKAGTGDFIFENYKEQDSDKYEEKALELMCRHFEFYGQLNSPDIEYVTRGAKLSCTHGNRYIYLDAARDHGVYDGKNPVLTCKDCKKEENIKDFGACGNGKFEPLYSEEAPHPAQTALNRNGQERYVCFPVLLGEWGYGDINSRSLLIGEVLIDKAYKVYKKESFDSGEFSEDTIEQIAKNQIQNMVEDVEYSQALMKCDNLLCLYGGVISIEENPEPEEEIVEELEKENEAIESGQFQFTLEQLIVSGWEGATEDDLRKLNEAMVQFGVTTKESAYMMLATMFAESTYCTLKLEGEPEYTEFTDETWKEYKEDMRMKGNRVGDYEWWERGAGYIQLTGQKVQREFLKAMEDNYSGFNTAEHIGNNYPIEASVYFWGVVEKTGEKNLNAYVAKHGASEGIFLITQYFTNSFVNGINSALESIRNGESYTIDIKAKRLIVNGQSFVLPNGWTDRATVWEKVYAQMQKSE